MPIEPVTDPFGRLLWIQLRIEEIDDKLEQVHIELADYIGLDDPLGIAAELRAHILRTEADLRWERQCLYDELEQHEH